MKNSLQQISENVFVYMGGTTNYGVITHKNRCIIIDTGLDKTSGQKLYQEVTRCNWKPAAIINTHAHADHFGGNNRLVELAKCPVYCSPWENNFLQEPILEPFSLFCGVNPPKNLQNKFLMAQKSPGEDIFQEGETLKEWGIEVVPLPGHTLGMIGIKKEDVLFTGDAYISSKVMEKHPIPFLMDVEESYKSLELLLTEPLNCCIHVIAHQGIYVRPEAACEIESYKDRIREIYLLLKESVQEGPKTTEQLMQLVLRYFYLEVKTLAVYQLIMVTIHAYLAALLNKQEIAPLFTDSTLYWCVPSTSSC
ncbi:MAG: MBL fold metallo-hydrolase [Bacillota bacterium]